MGSLLPKVIIILYYYDYWIIYDCPCRTLPIINGLAGHGPQLVERRAGVCPPFPPRRHRRQRHGADQRADAVGEITQACAHYMVYYLRYDGTGFPQHPPLYSFITTFLLPHFRLYGVVSLRTCLMHHLRYGSTFVPPYAQACDLSRTDGNVIVHDRAQP